MAVGTEIGMYLPQLLTQPVPIIFSDLPHDASRDRTVSLVNLGNVIF